MARHLVLVFVSQNSSRFPTTRPLLRSPRSIPTLSNRHPVAVVTSSSGGKFCSLFLVHCSFSFSSCSSGVAVRVKRGLRRRSSSSAISRSKVSGASSGAIHLPLGGLVVDQPPLLVVRRMWNACRMQRNGRATARTPTVAPPLVSPRASPEAAGSPWVNTLSDVARMMDART